MNRHIGIYLCLSLMMSVTLRVVDLAVTAVIKLAGMSDVADKDTSPEWTTDSSSVNLGLFSKKITSNERIAL